MNKLTLSYETTLPSHLYPYLRRLFSIQRFYVNNLIRELWWIERLYVSQNVWKMLDKVSERPPHIPSRVWRNICAEAGSVLRASYKRMILTEELLRKKELIDIPSWKVAEKLKTNCSYDQKQKAMDRKRMKQLGIIEPGPEAGLGLYRFVNEMYPVYVWLEQSKKNKEETYEESISYFGLFNVYIF